MEYTQLPLTPHLWEHWSVRIFQIIHRVTWASALWLQLSPCTVSRLLVRAMKIGPQGGAGEAKEDPWQMD